MGKQANSYMDFRIPEQGGLVPVFLNRNRRERMIKFCIRHTIVRLGVSKIRMMAYSDKRSENI